MLSELANVLLLTALVTASAPLRPLLGVVDDDVLAGARWVPLPQH